jgi:hypothetical protein
MSVPGQSRRFDPPPVTSGLSLGLGCVKTRRCSIAIEEIVRPRPLWSPNLHANSTWNELRNIILVAFRFFEFLQSHGQNRKWPQVYIETALPQRTDIASRELHAREVLHCSRDALKVGFQFHQCPSLLLLSLIQQRPALTRSKRRGLPV